MGSKARSGVLLFGVSPDEIAQRDNPERAALGIADRQTVGAPGHHHGQGIAQGCVYMQWFALGTLASAHAITTVSRGFASMNRFLEMSCGRRNAARETLGTAVFMAQQKLQGSANSPRDCRPGAWQPDDVARTLPRSLTHEPRERNVRP